MNKIEAITRNQLNGSNSEVPSHSRVKYGIMQPIHIMMSYTNVIEHNFSQIVNDLSVFYKIREHSNKNTFSTYCSHDVFQFDFD